MKSSSILSTFVITTSCLVMVTYCAAPPAQGVGAVDHLKQVCKKLCVPEHVCPPECAELFLDPWADSIIAKRASGLEGFTFDDYLFMRWLGRDMKRRGLFRR